MLHYTLHPPLSFSPLGAEAPQENKTLPFWQTFLVTMAASVVISIATHYVLEWFEHHPEEPPDRSLYRR